MCLSDARLGKSLRYTWWFECQFENLSLVRPVSHRSALDLERTRIIVDHVPLGAECSFP